VPGAAEVEEPPSVGAVELAPPRGGLLMGEECTCQVQQKPRHASLLGRAFIKGRAGTTHHRTPLHITAPHCTPLHAGAGWVRASSTSPSTVPPSHQSTRAAPCHS
jgi:hypothetical protein